MQRLILRSFQSPGDVVMLTAVLRDLHAAFPGRYQTDVRTSADALFDHNPMVTKLREGEPGLQILDMQYPLIHQSNQRPYHFLSGYTQFLEDRLQLKIPVTHFKGDIHLSAEEKAAPPSGFELPEHFWIVIGGGKKDFTAKWWNPASYQAVVDHFQGKIAFVQCGEAGHWHPPLENVINLVGKTSLRDFVRLMHHADGVLCPVTFAMHLAAAVETKPGRPRHRPCVVVAGGREPPHWEAYPQHRFLHTVGTLPCCADGGCWKSRCQLVGDGDEKDRRNVCERPVQVTPDLRIPQCQELIRPKDVIREIERYYQGGLMSYSNGADTNGAHVLSPGTATANATNSAPAPSTPPRKRPCCPEPAAANGTTNRTPVLIEFRHGLGDAVQLTVVLEHLRRHHPDWDVDVASLVGKHSAYSGLCRNAFAIDRDRFSKSGYRHVYTLDWHECRTPQPHVPSTKPARCLQEVFRITPDPELFRYRITVSEEARRRARDYLNAICPTGPHANGRYPAVLIHYEGNTSGEKKNLPHDVIREVCDVVCQQGHVPVILDWDRRSPLPDGRTVHCPEAGHALWEGLGTGDAESLAALIDASSLLIGVDSGPLHVAGATTTPTLGVWTHHHPVHYFDLADNVLHLVPGDHAAKAPAPAIAYFESHYRFETYKALGVDLPARVESLLGGGDFEANANKRYLRQLKSTAYGKEYYTEHKESGLDYLGFGDWQQRYARWLVDSLSWKGKRVLDVGCACGAILRGLGEAGAVVQGVDVNEHMIQLGRQQWPDMTPLLLICDAVNLHLFPDASWDAIHTAQVAEHWKPKLVPLILEELRRVTKPGGLLFCALDTEELFARQGRTLEHEDPTHVCIRPMSWWHAQLEANGWELCGAHIERRLRSHPDSYLTKHDWDWFVARAV